MAFFRFKERPDEKQISYADYGEEVIAAYNGIRGLRHDLRNHLDVMSALAGEENWHELAAYIRELSGQFHQLAAVTISGNAAVDALIASKLQQAQAMGIDLGTHVVLPYQTPLSAFEWTTLLGNLLDNALEASGGANAPYIQLNVSFAHGMLHIKMENAKAEGYAPPKKGRGLGLKRVAAVLDDHRGYMELEDGKNTFVTHIILPLEE